MTNNNNPTFIELFKQSLQDVEAGYDLLAPKFDNSPYVTPEVILEAFFKKLTQETATINSGLDLCCGTGAASVHLVNICKEKFTALDLSQGMLDQCEAKIKKLKPSIPIEFVKANALDMPFEEAFDLVVSFGAFGHILEKDEERFIKEIHKILKPSGAFFFITSNKLPWWSKSLWRQRLFNVIIGVRNFFIHPKFIMYYLTFRLPKVKKQLEANGFEVAIFDLDFQTKEDSLSDLMAIKYFKMVKAKKL